MWVLCSVWVLCSAQGVGRAGLDSVESVWETSSSVCKAAAACHGPAQGGCCWLLVPASLRARRQNRAMRPSSRSALLLTSTATMPMLCFLPMPCFLQEVGYAITRLPEDFTPHRQIAKVRPHWFAQPGAELGRCCAKAS